MDVPPIFNSVEDECRFWKERAKFYFTEWMDGKQEFEDYIEQSRQVEVEMDATLDQKEGMIKDLRMKLANSEKEIESLKVKHENHIIEFANVEKQLENVRMERDTIKENLRQLEQKNDDLERAHRILNESIVDFERMLDKAYEKNALLEMEVDEKEMLQEKLQRLMDETRDLKQELNVKARCTPNATANNSITAYANSIAVMEKSGCEPLGVLQNAMTTNNILPSTTATPTSPTSPTIKKEYSHRSLKNSENLLNGNAMTASSRTNALNIVADMLRKLNAMETKLKTYRDQSSTMHPRQ